MDIVERLRFDAVRCEATFSKGVASNIENAVTEIERLRDVLIQIKLKALSGCESNALGRMAYDALNA